MGDENQPPLTKESVKTSHHPHYYFEDGVVIFLVENTLFKVHRYYLTRESEVFRSMFESPSTSDGPEGSSDERPIVLPGITAIEFELLMDFFYQGMDREKTGRLPSFTLMDGDDPQVEEWALLLSIADRYVFTAVRANAMKHLDYFKRHLTPIKRLSLAMRYNIDHWKLPAYEELCLQEEPLSLEQASIMGLENFVLVANAREIVVKHRSTNSWPGRKLDIKEVGPLIRKVICPLASVAEESQ